jgi:hypothetical protein
MIGGFPFSGSGIKTSNGQFSTHRLQPLQISGLKMTGLPGAFTLGIEKVLFSAMSASL